MALKPCRTCGHLVSREARSCPHCGCPRPTTKPVSIWILALVAGGLIWGATVLPQPDPKVTSSPNRAALRTVTTASNIRSGPGTQHRIIKTVAPGDQLHLHIPPESGWYALASSTEGRDTVGYVAASLVTTLGSRRAPRFPVSTADENVPLVADENVPRPAGVTSPFRWS